jgi:hypothetical protein
METAQLRDGATPAVVNWVGIQQCTCYHGVLRAPPVLTLLYLFSTECLTESQEDGSCDGAGVCVKGAPPSANLAQ